MIKNLIDSAARQLLDARRSSFPLESLSSEYEPEDRETAYAIQDALIAASGEAIGGWKIAAGTGAAPVCSPLLASAYRTPGEPLSVARTMATIVEAEIAVRIGKNLPPRKERYTPEEIEAAIAALHPSLEILGSRFKPAYTPSPLLVIADLQNNSAVVTGPAKSDWRSIDPSQLDIILAAGGKTLSVSKGPSLTDILAALTWLANGRSHRYGGLARDQIIITGSRVNLPIGRPGERVRAEFADLGEIALMPI